VKGEEDQGQLVRDLLNDMKPMAYSRGKLGKKARQETIEMHHRWPVLPEERRD
jgi:hypothetical protein